MKNKKVTITAVLLSIFIGACYTTISDGSIRTVEFLLIFSIGALTGVLLSLIFQLDKKVNS